MPSARQRGRMVKENDSQSVDPNLVGSNPRQANIFHKNNVLPILAYSNELDLSHVVNIPYL